MKWDRYIIVCYDIKCDNIRTHLANRLVYYGLHRVQYSVFKGTVMLPDKFNILKEVEKMELGETDKVHIIDLCADCQKNQIIFGMEPEIKQHLIV